MEKSRGLFAEDFGPFMRPGSDTLGFSSKLETISEQLAEKEVLNGTSSRYKSEGQTGCVLGKCFH